MKKSKKEKNETPSMEARNHPVKFLKKAEKLAEKKAAKKKK